MVERPAFLLLLICMLVTAAGFVVEAIRRLWPKEEPKGKVYDFGARRKRP